MGRPRKLVELPAATEVDSEGNPIAPQEDALTRKSVTVNMPIEMYQHCDEFSELKHVSLSHVVRQALAKFTAYQGDIGQDRERSNKLTDAQKEDKKSATKLLNKVAANEAQMAALMKILNSMSTSAGPVDTASLLASLAK